MEQQDVIIIGAGPAGMSAAIYAGRAQLKTLMFGDPSRSNLYKSHIIGNYFGFPGSPTGRELSALGVSQVQQFGTQIIEREIVDIMINNDLTFTLKDDNFKEHQTKTVILATGQSYTLSGIKNEKELTGKGVSYCVTCDGFFFKNKKIAVIGGGNFAAKEALELLAYTRDITVLSHGKDFEFSSEIAATLQKEGIKTIKTARLAELSGPGKAEKIISIDGLEMKFDGFFMAIGVAGATAFAKKLGLEMEGNYIKVDKNGRTNLPGIFAAGDCTGGAPQVAASVGSGCVAALSTIKFVRGLNIYIQYN